MGQPAHQRQDARGSLGTLIYHGDKLIIGLLICKTKDNVFAQYALEGSNQPLGISEYELSKLYPEKAEGTIPLHRGDRSPVRPNVMMTNQFNQ